MQRRNDEVLLAQTTLFGVRLHAVRMNHLGAAIAQQRGKLDGFDNVVRQRLVANAARRLFQGTQGDEV